MVCPTPAGLAHDWLGLTGSTGLSGRELEGLASLEVMQGAWGEESMAVGLNWAAVRATSDYLYLS